MTTEQERLAKLIDEHYAGHFRRCTCGKPERGWFSEDEWQVHLTEVIEREYVAARVAEANAKERTAGMVLAREVVARQTDLTELMHFDKPSDFRKGVLTCLAALDAAIRTRGES